MASHNLLILAKVKVAEKIKINGRLNFALRLIGLAANSTGIKPNKLVNFWA
jgi:hypothetical protein